MKSLLPKWNSIFKNIVICVARRKLQPLNHSRVLMGDGSTGVGSRGRPLANGGGWGSLGGIVRVWISSFSLNKSYQCRESLVIARENQSVRKGGTTNSSRRIWKMNFCRWRHVQGEKRNELLTNLSSLIYFHIYTWKWEGKTCLTLRFSCLRDGSLLRGLRKYHKMHNYGLCKDLFPKHFV